MLNKIVLKVLLGCMLCLPLAASAAGFSLKDMQGKKQNLSDFKGRWVLVNFWATWCPPCLAELPDLISLHNAHKDIVVIGIAMDYVSGKVVADFVKKQGINYPIVLGNSEIAAQIGDAEVLPTSYLYNPAGVAVSYHAGSVTRQSIEAYISSHQDKKARPL
jgi:thiol-disulfide isomerase/thioredoxin